MRSFDNEMSTPFPKNDTDIVKCLKSGKWVAKIQNPISKVWVLLGAYTNPEEAAESCVKKKLDYESNLLQNTTVVDNEKTPGVKRTTSGKWAARIKHKGDQVWLGTYCTHKEASEAFRMSKLELQRSGSMQATRANDCNVSRGRKGKRKSLSTVSEVRYHHVYQRPSGRWQTEIRHPIGKIRVYLGTFDTAEEAQEAYNKKKSEFDMLGCDQSKQNWSAEDGSSSSNRRSAEPFVPCDRGLLINLDAEEFDLGVVDSYGRLIGEYSRLDEELLIC